MAYFAVLGSPIDHSLSPLIHQTFAKEANLSIDFQRILTQQGSLKATLAQFRLEGGQGACITLPLKIEAFELCQQLSGAAKTARAVNTIYWDKDMLCGDNTDGEGFYHFLSQDLALNLQAKRILILGAGGAVRGILGPLLKTNPASIVIVNRTVEKAQALISQENLKAYHYESFAHSQEAPFDLIINATSLSLTSQIPPIEAKWLKNTIAIELAYQKKSQTQFQLWAKEHGAIDTHDGIGMLVWQAALGFKRWHHFLPAIAPVIALLRQEQL